MWFEYDSDGNPVGFLIQGVEYLFIKNSQGDVVGLVNNGTVAAKYTNYSWGKITTSITDGNGNDVSSQASHIANMNPIRYRGYYYDAETGLYYLQSRYYDPQTHRFLNADGVSGVNPDINSYNMFTCSCNNPITYSDSSGHMVEIADGGNGNGAYKTEEEAATLFVKQYNPASQYQGREYVSKLYAKKSSAGKLYYSYTQPSI